LHLVRRLVVQSHGQSPKFELSLAYSRLAAYSKGEVKYLTHYIVYVYYYHFTNLITKLHYVSAAHGQHPLALGA